VHYNATKKEEKKGHASNKLKPRVSGMLDTSSCMHANFYTTLYSPAIEGQDHMYEEVAPQQCSRNIDKQNSERSNTMDSKKKFNLLPPTAKNIQPVSTSSDGVYMPLTLTTEKRELESHYMPLSAATRKTHSRETGAWKKVQDVTRVCPEEPVYMNQPKRRHRNPV
jgi:hypothetical protein